MPSASVTWPQAPRQKLRRRKTAGERCDHGLRAEARVLLRCTRALRAILSHRGCDLGTLGHALQAALVSSCAAAPGANPPVQEVSRASGIRAAGPVSVVHMQQQMLVPVPTIFACSVQDQDLAARSPEFAPRIASSLSADAPMFAPSLRPADGLPGSPAQLSPQWTVGDAVVTRGLVPGTRNGRLGHILDWIPSQGKCRVQLADSDRALVLAATNLVGGGEALASGLQRAATDCPSPSGNSHRCISFSMRKEPKRQRYWYLMRQQV